MNLFSKKNLMGATTLVVVTVVAGLFMYSLRPASADKNAAPVIFEVQSGDGSRTVIGNMGKAGLIRSPLAVEFLSLLDGTAFELQPGLYRFGPAMSPQEMLNAMATLAARVVTATIPEGSNLYEIDVILSNALVIHRGDLINFKSDGNVEGKLFPDTYNFFTNTDIATVVQKFIDNFDAKAMVLLRGEGKDWNNALIVASIVEKEVPDPHDQKIVAGILGKRLAAGMPLDVDASICYAKRQAAPLGTTGCYPLTPLDFKIDSPYNTYLYKGLPPAPIGNPGISAIDAALHPESSPYWFYLSDPKTGKTIYARTLSEQEQNRRKYLQ